MDVSEPEGELTDVHFCALRDQGNGDYWLYPSRVHYPPEIAWEEVDVVAGVELNIAVIPTFVWPDTGDSGMGGIFIHSAIMDAEMSEILGEVSSVEFGYGPFP